MQTSSVSPADVRFHNLIENILDEIFVQRRHFQGEGNCATESCRLCRTVHKSKIEKRVSQGLPIQFILPAFPAKSVNPEKTASAFPDMGEILSLRFLNALCRKIALFYQPGAFLTVCSDGRVFNDLVKVKDINVEIYAQGIKSIIENDRLNHLRLFKFIPRGLPRAQ